MTQVVVRFAPSPTGKLHIGSARTAIYNWLYARHTGGKMLLRIEDTDLERSTEENVQIIVNGLRWLEIDWDEEPVFQSKRVDLYRPLIDKLIDEGKAYRCVCTKEELDEKRTKAIAEKGKALYDRTCRDKNLGPDCGQHTIRLAMPPRATSLSMTLSWAKSQPPHWNSTTGSLHEATARRPITSSLSPTITICASRTSFAALTTSTTRPSNSWFIRRSAMNHRLSRTCR